MLPRITEALATTCRSVSIVPESLLANGSGQKFIARLPRDWSRSLHHGLKKGVDPTVVSPGAIWWRDSRGYCLDCLMNSTRLKRRADQSSSIATWRTLSNPA